MEVRSYNAELGLAHLQFKHVFSNIVIERMTRKGEKKEIHVECVNGQRSRILKNWENAEKRAQMELPMIAINRTGYSRNAERLNNLHNEVKREITSKRRSYDLLTPVPIDINYDVSIIAKYQEDIDQIASNFMLMFNNDGYLNLMHPKFEGLQLKNQIIVGDQVSEEHPDELDGSQDDLYVDTFQFTFKTYLFGGQQKAVRAPEKIVSSFMSSYVDTKISCVSIADLSSSMDLSYTSKISVVLTSDVTEEVTAFVDNPDPSAYVYEGIVPIINAINMGFYPTPGISGHIPYFEFVDAKPVEEQPPYVDRVIWTITENGLSMI